MTRHDRTVAVSELPGILKKGQCMGCGFCSVSLKAEAHGQLAHAEEVVEFAWDDEVEHWGPRVSHESLTTASAQRRICPGAVMDMPALANDVFGRQPDDPILGEARRIAAGHAASDTVRRRAASGGITTALLTRLFETNRIDAAYCADGRDPKAGGGVVKRTPDSLSAATGSHYHPIAFGKALGELADGRDRFAFVGLPCHVAAMRELMLARPDIEERCVVIIGLFCGGITRFSGIGRYLERFGVDPRSVLEIDYRDGAWPGQIRVELDAEAQTRFVPRILGNTLWNILHYMISFQGYWMLPRCRICPDQVADFADISVGDPHLPRFKSQNSDGVSAVVARTSRGLAVLDEAESAGAIVLSPLSRDEVVQSQGYTLENRRHALVYAEVAGWLGIQPPLIKVYDGLQSAMNWHQYVYAFVDLAKIRYRKVKWLRPFYLPLQIFEYLFLTFSPRLIMRRLIKLMANR